MSESIRIKIAKWLAPEVFEGEKSAIFMMERFKKEAAFYAKLGTESDVDLEAALKALRDIARLRTPKCSHVVKKACDIADAALSHPSIPTQEAE